MARISIMPADGKLGILLPGLGAVSTTLIAGTLLVRKGALAPVGSLTQMQTIRLGKRDEKRSPKIKDFVPLAKLEDLEFAARTLGNESPQLRAFAGAARASEENIHPGFCRRME